LPGGLDIIVRQSSEVRSPHINSVRRRIRELFVGYIYDERSSMNNREREIQFVGRPPRIIYFALGYNELRTSTYPG
jgi:hypothetical protein